MRQPLFDYWADMIRQWFRIGSSRGLNTEICMVVYNHYPPSLRQYAANEIWLRYVQLEFGVTP
jgi:hypothetical protein